MPGWRRADEACRVRDLPYRPVDWRCGDLFAADWAPRPCAKGATVLQSVAVPVESWDAYTRLYGAFEGPGLLPYAVASFFENGGRRAYIVRIVHCYPGDDPDAGANAKGVAAGTLVGLGAGGSAPRKVWLRARDEGAWGNTLRATLSFQTRPLGLPSAAFEQTGFTFPRGTDIGPGTVLRIDLG